MQVAMVFTYSQKQTLGVCGELFFGRRLGVRRYALGLTVAARQNIAYAHTASHPS